MHLTLTFIQKLNHSSVKTFPISFQNKNNISLLIECIHLKEESEEKSDEELVAEELKLEELELTAPSADEDEATDMKR